MASTTLGSYWVHGKFFSSSQGLLLEPRTHCANSVDCWSGKEESQKNKGSSHGKQGHTGAQSKPTSEGHKVQQSMRVCEFQVCQQGGTYLAFLDEESKPEPRRWRRQVERKSRECERVHFTIFGPDSASYLLCNCHSTDSHAVASAHCCQAS